MSTAWFRFPEELARFLRAEHRSRRFAYACARAANLKNAVEALGVPATLQRIVRMLGFDTAPCA